ncbi:hypothetical protein JRQ81_009169 [Phrynocephalus forsythii]|uniref:Uncharacterized protein n=1 Tax=Phrynocephalus forsythii TaxID=171643 RepID=A0A9Q1B7H4_9SAUR|nr:hypothetical protein JRQ81_009169 [Phrynocephalus forsythii]
MIRGAKAAVGLLDPRVISRRGGWEFRDRQARTRNVPKGDQRGAALPRSSSCSVQLGSRPSSTRRASLAPETRLVAEVLWKRKFLLRTSPFAPLQPKQRWRLDEAEAEASAAGN